MKSKNYDPQNCYFAVQYSSAGYTDLIRCYGIPADRFEALSPFLETLDQADDWRHKMVGDYLTLSGAAQNDFYDDASGLVYPGQLNFNRITKEITGVSFYNKGLRNDPLDNFPARIQEFGKKIKLQFFNNGEQWQHPYLNDSYKAKDGKAKEKAMIFTKEENYKDLSAFFDDNKSLIALPALPKEYSVIILKNC